MATLSNRFSEADQLYVDAIALLKAGEVSKAAHALVVITDKFENYGKAWTELGTILMNYLEDVEGAADCFRKAVELNPVYAPGYIAYADALFAIGKFAEMNAILNQAGELKSVKMDQVLQRSALLMESQNRFDEAIVTYKKAILASYSDDEISKCVKGIERCKLKENYL
jgi:tetratricopeptide (TPR) repeat protein